MTLRAMAAIAVPSTNGFNGTSNLSGIWLATSDGFVPFFSASWTNFFFDGGRKKALRYTSSFVIEVSTTFFFSPPTPPGIIPIIV